MNFSGQAEDTGESMGGCRLGEWVLEGWVGSLCPRNVHNSTTMGQSFSVL